VIILFSPGVFLAAHKAGDVVTVFDKYEGGDHQRTDADGKWFPEEGDEHRHRKSGDHGAKGDIFPFVHYRHEQQDGYQAGNRCDGQVDAQGGGDPFTAPEPLENGELMAQEGSGADDGKPPRGHDVRMPQVLAGQKYGQEALEGVEKQGDQSPFDPKFPGYVRCTDIATATGGDVNIGNLSSDDLSERNGGQQVCRNKKCGPKVAHMSSPAFTRGRDL